MIETSLHLLQHFLGLILGLEHAYADYSVVNNVVQIVGGPLANLQTTPQCDIGGGACGFVVIAFQIMRQIRPFVYGIGALMITIFGFRMIISQEDDILEKSRAIISATLSGIVLVSLIEPFINAFYGVQGEVYSNPSAGAGIVNTEVGGIIDWALVIVAVLAMLIIIITGIKAVTSATSEEGIANMRKAIFAIGAGILLIVFRGAISATVGANNGQAPSPIPVLDTIVHIISFVLGMMAVVAAAIVIYAGILMILNFGKDEQIQKARSLLIRALLGLALILVSLGIVQFVIGLVTG